MYLNPSTHDRSLSFERLPRKKNKKNSPFPFSSDSKYSVGQVSGDAFDREREWRDTPPLDRLSAGCRRDANESNAIQSPGEEEVSTDNPDGPRSRK